MAEDRNALAEMEERMATHTLKKVNGARECRVCLGRHDEDVHSATVTIHMWLRREVARRISSGLYEAEAIGSVSTSLK